MRESAQTKTSKKRLIFFLILLIAAFLGAMILLMEYQIVDGAEYLAKASQNNQSTQTVQAARGDITDRYGRVLVTNELQLNLQLTADELPSDNAGINQVISDLLDLLEQKGVPYVDTFPISQTAPYTFLEGQEAAASQLKAALSAQDYATAQNCMDLLIEKYEIYGYSEERTRDIAGIRAQMLMDSFSDSNPYTFVENIDGSLAGEIMEQKDSYPGVQLQETYNRIYPSKDIASHLIGTVGPIYQEEYDSYKEKGYPMDAIVGKSGIELAMEDQLRGIDGKKTIVKDENGQVIEEYYAQGQEPSPGDTVVLTIDSKLQKELQDAMESYMLSLRSTSTYHSAKGAAVCVLDVKTGECLALVSYPSYDINEYRTNYEQLSSNPYKPLFNRALMGTYRPGSTFKTVMSVGGLLCGAFTKDTVFNCVNPYPGTHMNCLQNHHSGPTNLNTALKYSCNNYFYHVGDNMGIDNINYYAHAMGLGTETGLEISNAVGHIASPEYYEDHGMQWQWGNTLQASIGQAETMVTPLQMAISMMTIANHGTRYASHLVKGVEAYDYSEPINETQPAVMSTLPDENSAYSATIEGMKQMATTVPELQGIDIAAKSGTPEFYENGVYKTNSAAVAIYPASDPEIAISIMIEEGGKAANFLRQVVDIYEGCKTQEVETPQSVGVLLS